MVTHTIDSVRQFSRDLRPTVLEDLGMVPALQYLVNELAQQDTLDITLDMKCQLPVVKWSGRRIVKGVLSI